MVERRGAADSELSEQDEWLWLRLVDVLCDHTGPKWRGRDEVPPPRREAAESLWRRTTPADYVATLDGKDATTIEARVLAELRAAIAARGIDDVLFLALVLSRLPGYALAAGERRPWGCPEIL